MDGGKTTPQADWDANKTLHPPKYYDRVLAAVGAGNPLGTSVGSETHTLTLSETPTHDHEVSSGSAPTERGSADFPVQLRQDSGGESGTFTQTTTSVGDGDAHNNRQPTFYTNIMVKL